jgi:deazaflavin-dependent oxidoreductase (nitroreductase family)
MTTPADTNPTELPAWIRDHVKRYQATDGKDGHLWDATVAGYPGKVPTLLLTTVGRRSGRSLTLPLIYGKSGDDYVIVASRGGHPTHPAWYQNLAAQPRVHVQVLGDRFTATARSADGDEHARLWKLMRDIYPPYDDYQKRATGRRIPVVVLRREK